MNLLKMSSFVAAICLLSIIAGCSPEVGSKEWCEDMKEKPKGDWTASEATDYAKHCVFKQARAN